MQEKYKVTGMSCAACSARVEKAVSSIEGVESCSVNLLSGRMIVEGNASRESVASAVRAAGYGVADDKVTLKAENTARPLFVRLMVSLVLLIALMYISMGRMLGLPQPSFLDSNSILTALLQAIISLTVLIINSAFFVNGARGALKGAPNMDTLVALGSGASYLYSLGVLIAMTVEISQGGDPSHYLHDLYFESSAMILVLITVGKTLEQRAKGKTTSAIGKLLSLSPKTATLLRDGEEVVVSVDEMRVGDVFVLRPGESVPVDGEVILGEGSIDESCLTGESVPADKTVGSAVIGGTVNRAGFMHVRSTAVGDGTVLSSIIRMVEDASSTKAPIAKLADKVSGVFVPTVIGIAIVTFVGWLIAGQNLTYAVARGISVLVISCPCALGLATPVAIMVGSGVGAGRGVLFKNATALEQSGRVNIAVLDKTGTLTKGEPKVIDVVSMGCTREELLSFAYSVEYPSEHPLGCAVVDYCRANGAELHEATAFEAKIGRGVSCKIDNIPCYGASLDYAKTLTIIDKNVEELYEKMADEGKTPVFFVRDGKLLGAIALADVVKEDAYLGVATLRSMGVTPVMVTGDNPRTASAMAKKCGIDRVYAGVLPDGKGRIVEELKREGAVVMVGDGINDAPALTCADVGIAMGRGTDIAIESADVVIVGESFMGVPTALGVGRATLRNIKQNLFFAFLYNCICIPLAAGLFGFGISPMIGAAAMSLSSFSVVSNALRLNLWKPKIATVEGDDNEIHLQNANNNLQTYSKNESEDKNMNVTVKVDGMMCPHCEARVKKALEAIPGVASAAPSHKDGKVDITLSSEVELSVIERCIEDQGYTVLR